jgi:hypothetical protein
MSQSDSSPVLDPAPWNCGPTSNRSPGMPYAGGIGNEWLHRKPPYSPSSTIRQRMNLLDRVFSIL